MDAQPSTSTHLRDEETLSPRKKRKSISFTQTEKELILNAYKFAYTAKKTESPTETPKKNECVLKTSEILNISRASIYRVLKEHKKNENFNSPRTRGPKFNIKNKLDDFTLSVIRRKVHEFFYRKELPTLNKVLEVLNEDPDLPSFSRRTLRKILITLNFKYMTRKRVSGLIDRENIILWRHRYLLKIKEYRREGRIIYYQDETWINEGHTVSKHWVDTTIHTSRQAFIEGLTTGLKGPSGKGRRLIVSHIGNEDGFVDDGALIFETKKIHEDYHTEMNSEIYENWLKDTLPKLKRNSILIIDNAPYHSRKVESLPTTNWRKQQIQDWLKSKNIPFEDTMLKAELTEIARKYKSNYAKYVVDEMAAKWGVAILRLPPYHCELNSIELVWAQVKGYVAKNNKTYKLNEVRSLFEEGLRQVTPQRWKDCIAHVLKTENKMCELGHIVDDITDRVIIGVGYDSDSSETLSAESLYSE